MATALQMCRYSGSRQHVRNSLHLHWSYLTFLCGFRAPCQELQTAEHKFWTFVPPQIAKTDLASITNELLGDFNEFLDLVGHVGRVRRLSGREGKVMVKV